MEQSFPEVLVNLHNTLGEGPVWDEREQSLYWVDGLGCKWFRRDRSGAVSQFETKSPIGSLVLTKSGGLVAALSDGIYSLDAVTGAAEEFVNPEAGIKGNRFNDGKADPGGRFVVGSMSVANNDGSGNAPASGGLYSIGVSGQWKKLRSGIGISNGMAWNRAGDRFYYVDSAAGCVFSYAYHAENGSINEERVCIRIPGEEGVPDGMTIDEEGKLWVAHWGGWCVSRFDPESGKLLARIKLPVKHVTCCAFGGANLDQLFITTSTNAVSGIEWLNQPLAGALFVAEPGVKGTIAHRFA